MPRLRLLTAPYAFLAKNSIHANNADNLVNANRNVVMSVLDTNVTIGGTVSATTVSGNGTIPIGGIIMWSGATVPTGWALCNGQTVNGSPTPNLQNRFIVGSGSTYANGATGGLSSVTLNANQIPAHTHGYKDAYWVEVDISSSTTTTGNGGLSIGRDWDPNVNVWGASGGDMGNNCFHWRAMTTYNNTTTGSPIPILPPYYALAYIMRVY